MLSCALAVGTWSAQIVPSTFIIPSVKENLKGRDKINLKEEKLECLKQVLK